MAWSVYTLSLEYAADRGAHPPFLHAAYGTQQVVGLVHLASRTIIVTRTKSFEARILVIASPLGTVSWSSCTTRYVSFSLSFTMSTSWAAGRLVSEWILVVLARPVAQDGAVVATSLVQMGGGKQLLPRCSYLSAI